MIFKPELAAKVLDGSKTMTRRPVKPGEPCRYVPERTYAVQDRRGGKSLGRIYIEDVWQEPLGFIHDSDARHEGFASREEFLRYWHRLYGNTKLKQPVWVIAFELDEETAQNVA